MYRYRYAVDPFLMLCYPKFPVYSCFTKTMRGSSGRQCYLDSKLKMFFNASYHVVSELMITELCSLLYLLNKLNPTSDVATFADSAIYTLHIFATKRDSLSQ